MGDLSATEQGPGNPFLCRTTHTWLSNALKLPKEIYFIYFYASVPCNNTETSLALACELLYLKGNCTSLIPPLFYLFNTWERNLIFNFLDSTSPMVSKYPLWLSINQNNTTVTFAFPQYLLDTRQWFWKAKDFFCWDCMGGSRRKVASRIYAHPGKSLGYLKLWLFCVMIPAHQVNARVPIVLELY